MASILHPPCKSGLPERLADFLSLRHTDPARFWQRCLFWSFWLHMTIFAVGYGFREVMPLICLVFLGLYYRHAWHESIFHRLTIRPLFYCLWIMMLIGVAFSLNPWASFLETATSFNKGLILPFIAMESVRSLKDLKRLVWGSMLAFFWVGLDGIYQYCTGFDFIMGYPIHSGRLTSALADYCVGNYLAQIFVPALGVWYICRQKLGLIASAAVCLLLSFPGLFTLYGTQTRAALLALVACALVWLACIRVRHWKKILGLVLLSMVLAYALMQSSAGRLSLERIFQDGRWSLWSLALAIVREWPIFGAGAEMFNPAFRSLGLVPARDAITIEHPHNLYLDILCSTGIVGALFGFIFLFGMLWWLGKHLLPRLARNWQPAVPSEAPGCSRMYWQLTGLFALGYLAWLVNGIFGHEFYRMWWLGQAMQGLGVAIGALVLGLEGEKEHRQAFTVSYSVKNIQ